MKRTKSEIDQHLAKKGTRNQASLDLPAPEERQRQTNVIHKKSDKKSYGEIVYVRTRMFYSRPEENLKGDVVFGLHRMRMWALVKIWPAAPLISHVC